MSNPVDRKEEKTPPARPVATPPPVPPEAAPAVTAEPRRRRETDPLRYQLLHLTGILLAGTLSTLAMVYQSKPGILAAVAVAFATNAKAVIGSIFDTLAKRKK